MTQVLHKTKNMFRLSLQNIERTTPYYKKRTNIWLVVMKTWQREREHTDFNIQVEAREQWSKSGWGGKKQLKISFFFPFSEVDRW